MARLRFVQVMIALLIVAYAFALAVSTAHLSQLYRVYDGGLPPYVSMGLAIALEIVAFLLSIISTSLGRLAGGWAPAGATLALALVWAGNGYAMFKAAPNEPLVVTLFASCFVPVSTFIVGKVLGGLFTLAQRPDLLQDTTTTDMSRTDAAPSQAQHAPKPLSMTGETLKPGQFRARATIQPARQRIHVRPAAPTDTTAVVSVQHNTPHHQAAVDTPAAAVSRLRTSDQTDAPVPQGTEPQGTEPQGTEPQNEAVADETMPEPLTTRRPDNMALTTREARGGRTKLSAREVIIKHLEIAPRSADELASLMRAPVANIERELALLGSQVEKQNDQYVMVSQANSA